MKTREEIRHFRVEEREPLDSTQNKNWKKVEDKAPRVLGPGDRTIHFREEGPTGQLRGDSEVAGKWINGQYVL